MVLMERVETRGGATLEVITFVTNKGPTGAAGMVEEVIIAPIPVIHWAIVAVIISVVIHRPVCTDTPDQYK